MNQRTYRNLRPYKYNNSTSSDLIHLLLFYILPFIIVNAIIIFLATTKPDYGLTISGTNDYRCPKAPFS